MVATPSVTVGGPVDERELVPEPVTEESLRKVFSAKQILIIRTTYQAVSEGGSHRVSLQEIADRADVSKGIILYHFKTKSRLLLRTMEWVLQRNAARIRSAIVAESTPLRQVRVMIEVIFRDAESNRRFYLTYLDFLDHAARVDEFSKLHATFQSIVNALYADLIRSGVVAGVFDVADVDEAASTMRAIIDGLFLQWLQESDWRGLHDHYREMCERAVLTYLRATFAGAQEAGEGSS